MQESKKEKSNRVRRQATRSALIKTARGLFAEKGYAQTGTPEIVSAAGVTRGALYHHFPDKVELFRAVIEQEAQAVAELIADQTSPPSSALEGMLRGSNAYFEAMSYPGRAQLLLVEGPAILGIQAVAEVDRITGQQQLRLGLELAVRGSVSALPLDALAAILSAAFDRAALAIAIGEPIEEYQHAIRILVEGIPGMRAA